MATGKIAVGESSTPSKNLATYSNTEDAVLKEVQRVSLNTSTGSELLPVLAAQVPATLGTKTMANSLSTTMASDQVVTTNISQVGNVIVDSAGITTRTRKDFVESGRYFVGQINPTIGTGVAISAAAQNAFSATAPNIMISPTSKAVTLDRIVLQVTGAGASLSSLQIAVVIDTTNRYTSGGTTLTCKSIPSQTASTSTVRVGTTAIVASAAGSTAQLVYRTTIKSAIPAVNDVYNIEFSNDCVSDGITGTRYNIKSGPIKVQPIATCLIYIWGPSQTTAPTFEGSVYFTE